MVSVAPGPAPAARGGAGVQVVGLADFVRDLRTIDRGLPRAVSAAHRSIATVIRDESRSEADSLGGVHAKSAPAISSTGQQRKAAIRIDGDRFPFALGAEFGAKRYAQFPEWRGNQWQPEGDSGVGYMVHPTIRNARDDIVEIYDLELIGKLAARSFPN